MHVSTATRVGSAALALTALLSPGGGATANPAAEVSANSIATALHGYGADYRFRTPVYRLGDVKDQVLAGDLVLVASGDFNFGLRNQRDGTLAFNSLPKVDQNTTYTGFPGGAYVKDSDPLAALDALADQVKAAGIGEIKGDVAINVPFSSLEDYTAARADVAAVAVAIQQGH